MTRRAAATAVALAVLIGGSASADPKAEAVVLFDQGIQDMKAGRLDKACSELQASLQLVKDSGTKGALARCLGRSGRIASAWLLWRELSDTAPTAELRADAAAQAGRLERRLPRYTLVLAGPTPGLVVQVNGRDVAVDVPVAVPIDPGTLSVTAFGRDGDRITTQRWSHDYTAAEGQTVAIEIPALPVLPPPPPVAAPAAPPSSDDTEIAHSRHRRHIAALVIGGVAVGAAVAGTVFGLDASSKYSDAKQQCGGAIDACDPARLASARHGVDDARSAALRADILFGVAGAAAAAAVIVWVTAPSLESRPVAVAPSLGRGSAGLVVVGAF